MNSDELKKLVDSLGGNAVLDAMRLTQEEDKLTKELRTQMEFEKTIRAPIHPTNNFPRIDLPANQNLASEFHTRLINWINDFHKNLDNEHEVGARLVSFGQAVTFHIDDISYWNPSLISFIGKNDNGEPVELIQHVSQISILLVALKRENFQQPKRPIGFASWEEFEAQKT